MMARQLNTTPMTLAQLLPTIDFPTVVGDISVHGFSIDSRNILNGFVFVAAQGVHVHGETFIPSAIQQGAVAVFIEGESDLVYNNGVPIVAIPKMEQRLSEIVGHFYGHPTQSVNVVGVTGTNGKTTCAQMYAQLCALAGTLTGVVGTNGYGVCSLRANTERETLLTLTPTGMTTPDAISSQAICAELVAAGSQHIVMEVSSHGLEQSRVANIYFNGAIFTNLSHDHLDYHGDMESYGDAKAKLFAMESLTFAIINIDDPFAEKLLAQIPTNIRVITYSILNSAADIFLSDIQYLPSSTQVLLHSKLGVYALTTPLVGQFNLSNLLAVLCAFYPIGNDEKAIAEFDKIIALIPNIQAISGRLESIANTINRQVLVDFAHTPDALKNVLQAIREYATANVYCVFGCGGDRDNQKRALMAEVAETYADYVVVTNDNPRNEAPQKIISDICLGFSTAGHQVVLDREEAIQLAIQKSSENDVILIAGKGHEDYQLIGDVKTPFSDQSVARLVLRKMEAAL